MKAPHDRQCTIVRRKSWPPAKATRIDMLNTTGNGRRANPHVLTPQSVSAGSPCIGAPSLGIVETPKICVTFFPNKSAQSMRMREMSLVELRDLIQSKTARVKSRLPWLKLATFGETRTEKNCLRHNANVLSISGIELDYDAKQMTLDAGIAIAEKARLQALFYTSASYTEEAPKWRMLLPTSQLLPSSERAKLVARVNGLYGGVFADESFALSQSYYFGSVDNNPAHRAVITEGDCIDLRDDLGAIGKSGKHAPPDKVNTEKNLYERHAEDLNRPPLAKVAAALAAFPNNDDVDRAQWVDIGMAVKSAYPGEDGLALFREWSKSWTGWRNGKTYNDAYLVEKWKSFAPHSITAGTLFHFADRVSSEWRNAEEKQKTDTGKQPRFKLIPFQDLTPGKARNYLVKGLIPRIGLVVIWGPPKCFKSFWTFDLTMHVALGMEYRGRRVQQGAVVYCAFEGASGFGARAQGVREQYGIEPNQEVPFFLSPLRMNLVKDHKALIASVQAQIETPSIVVLDTLNRSLEGSESSDEDMGAYLSAADAIREVFNCCVVIVHHCGIEGTRPRGHTSLSGAVDAQLAVEREAGTLFANVTVEWMKDGPEGDVIESELERVGVGTDEDGDEISTLMVKPSSITIETSTHLGGALGVAFRLLRQALDNEGQIITDNKHVPRDRPVISLDTWRSYCYAGMVTKGETQSAKRKAFRRVVEKLQERRLIGVWEEHVWV
jgi:hypothetical protein